MIVWYFIFHLLAQAFYSVLLPGLFLGLVLGSYQLIGKWQIRPLLKPSLVFLGFLILGTTIAFILWDIFLWKKVFYEWDSFTGPFSLTVLNLPTLTICPSWILYGWKMIDLYLLWVGSVLAINAASLAGVYAFYRTARNRKQIFTVLVTAIVLGSAISFLVHTPTEQLTLSERNERYIESCSNYNRTAWSEYDFTDEMSVSFIAPDNVQVAYDHIQDPKEGEHKQITITIPQALYADSNPNETVILITRSEETSVIETTVIGPETSVSRRIEESIDQYPF